MRQRCNVTDITAFNVIIVPGDIGSEMGRIESVFRILVERYDLVCYIPGNHEAWKRGTVTGDSPRDSIEKLRTVVACARRCGVAVSPVRITCSQENSSENGGSVVIIPMHGWYHSGWDKGTSL